MHVRHVGHGVRRSVFLRLPRYQEAGPTDTLDPLMTNDNNGRTINFADSACPVHEHEYRLLPVVAIGEALLR